MEFLQFIENKKASIYHFDTDEADDGQTIDLKMDNFIIT